MLYLALLLLPRPAAGCALRSLRSLSCRTRSSGSRLHSFPCYLFAAFAFAFFLGLIGGSSCRTFLCRVGFRFFKNAQVYLAKSLGAFEFLIFRFYLFGFMRLFGLIGLLIRRNSRTCRLRCFNSRFRSGLRLLFRRFGRFRLRSLGFFSRFFRTGLLGCRAVYGIQVYLADGFYTDHHIGLSFYHLRFRLFREIFRCSCFCGSLSCGFFLLGFLRFRLLLFLGYPLFLLFLALCLINLLYQLFFALVLLESLFKDLINVSLYLRVRVGFYLYAFFGQILHCPIHRDVEFG